MVAAYPGLHCHHGLGPCSKPPTPVYVGNGGKGRVGSRAGHTSPVPCRMRLQQGGSCAPCKPSITFVVARDTGIHGQSPDKNCAACGMIGRCASTHCPLRSLSDRPWAAVRAPGTTLRPLGSTASVAFAPRTGQRSRRPRLPVRTEEPGAAVGPRSRSAGRRWPLVWRPHRPARWRRLAPWPPRSSGGPVPELPGR